MENKISYILSAEDIKEIYFATGVLKPYKRKMIGIVIISIVLLFITIVPDEPLTYISAAALLFMNLFSYFYFRKNEENTIRSAVSGEVTTLTAYDEYINVQVQAYDADWNIEKQDVFAILESENHVIIQLDDGRLMPFPKKSINDANKQSFEKVLNYLCDKDNQNKELGE